ncbi:hypothetical protein Dimus_006412 [Dionaea muscipula]
MHTPSPYPCRNTSDVGEWSVSCSSTMCVICLSTVSCSSTMLVKSLSVSCSSTMSVLHGPSGPEVTSEFEHSSILATMKMLFNLKNFLTQRDTWAGTFEGLLTGYLKIFRTIRLHCRRQ